MIRLGIPSDTGELFTRYRISVFHEEGSSLVGYWIRKVCRLNGWCSDDTFHGALTQPGIGGFKGLGGLDQALLFLGP